MHEKWTLSLFLITLILIGLTIVYIRYKLVELKQLEDKLAQISDKSARYVTYTDVMDVVQHSDQYRRLVDQQSQLSNHIGTLYQHNNNNVVSKRNPSEITSDAPQRQAMQQQTAKTTTNIAADSLSLNPALEEQDEEEEKQSNNNDLHVAQIQTASAEPPKKLAQQTRSPGARRVANTTNPHTSSDTDDVHSDGSFDFAAAVER